jgi:hypothetical protein
MSETFAPDPRIQQIAEAYAIDAVDFAKASFRLTLDGSDESVRHVETILARLHADLPTSKPSEEQIYSFAKLLGSYVGEVYRKNHGGAWGMVTMRGGESFPGMQSATHSLFWPCGQAKNRIVDGPENNLWHYYQVLTGGPEAVSFKSEPDPVHELKKPWWKRLLGG